MKREPVKESSNLVSIGYDGKTKTLQIEFQNGGIYEYWPINLKLYKRLKDSEFKGKFFAREIRNDSTISYRKMDTLGADI